MINALPAGLLHDAFVMSLIRCALIADDMLSLSHALGHSITIQVQNYFRTFHSAAPDA